MLIKEKATTMCLYVAHRNIFMVNKHDLHQKKDSLHCCLIALKIKNILYCTCSIIFLDIQDIPWILIYQYSNVSNVWFHLLSFTLTGSSLIICLLLLSDLPLNIVLVILENVHKCLAIDLLIVIDQYLFV